MGKRHETDVGRAVVEHLRSRDWTVYQEVLHRGSVADIVATIGHVVWIVECKTSLTFDVIAQAQRWVRGGWAHYVSVAVPHAKRSDGRDLAMRVLEREGLGCFCVGTRESFTVVNGVMSRPLVSFVEERARAPLHRSARSAAELRKGLREEQLSQVAGTAGGGHWTPFRHTCDQIRQVVLKEPGISLKGALDQITHHYASDATAKSSLPIWIERGKVDGVRLVIEKGKRRLYPAEVSS